MYSYTFQIFFGGVAKIKEQTDGLWVWFTKSDI